MTILLALVLALVPVWLVRSRGTATQIMAGLIAQTSTEGTLN